MWTIPAKSLDEATSAGPGAELDLHEVKSDHAFQWTVELGSAGDRVDVEGRGSLDGVNWYPLGPAVVIEGSTSQVLLSLFDDKPARYTRAEVRSVVTGTATVTAHLTSRP
jgi:hypothetical protein